MSSFIDNSKHAAMTAAVESHFGTSSKRTMPGVASGKGFPMGGTTAWNGTQSDQGSIERGVVNSAPSGAPAGASQFNASNPALPRETGVNYKPLANAGHTVTDPPFAGTADGLPGDTRRLWRK